MPGRSQLRLFGVLLLFVASCSGGLNTDPLEEIVDLSPRFSPDGSRIVFASDRLGSTDLHVLTVATGAVEQLTSAGGVAADPTYAPDGSVVYVHRPTPDDPWSMYRFKDGETITILGAPDSSAYPDVSNSEEVVYACVLPGRFGICVVGLDGSEPQVIHDDPGARDWEPVWSPDGQSVAFVSDRDGDDEIFVLGRDGSLRQITDNEAKDADPAWSPDGTQLAFTSDRDGSLAVWIMNADGTDPRRLVDGNKPAWSPDGRTIAHHATPPLPDFGPAIAITNTATGETDIMSRG